MLTMENAPAAFFGRRTVAIGYGAKSVAQSLDWPGEDKTSDNDDVRTLRRRPASFSDSVYAAETRDDDDVDVNTPRGWVVRGPVSADPEAEVRSEHSDRFRHYVPAAATAAASVNNAGGGTGIGHHKGDYDDVDAEAERQRHRHEASSSFSTDRHGVLMSAAATRANRHDAGVGAQTDVSTFLRRAPPVEPNEKVVVKSPIIDKPPFAAYGRGNARPVRSIDQYASYNLNPLLHPGSEKVTIAKQQGATNKVFNSALSRLGFDASTFNAKSLKARGIGVGNSSGSGVGSSTSMNLSLSSTTRLAAYPACDEVSTFPSLATPGCRDVATQRTSFQLEDEILQSNAQGDMRPLDLARLTVVSSRLRRLEGHRYGAVGRVQRDDDIDAAPPPRWRSKQVKCAPPPFHPGRRVLKRDEYIAGRRASPPPPLKAPPPTPPRATIRATPGSLRRGSELLPPLPPPPPPPPASRRLPHSIIPLEAELPTQSLRGITNASNESEGVAATLRRTGGNGGNSGGGALASTLVTPTVTGRAIGAPVGSLQVTFSGARVPVYELVPLPPDLSALSPPPARNFAPQGPTHVLPPQQETLVASTSARHALPPPPIPSSVSLTFNTKTWQPLGGVEGEEGSVFTAGATSSVMAKRVAEASAARDASKAARALLPRNKNNSSSDGGGDNEEKPAVALGVAGFNAIGARAAGVARSASPPKGLLKAWGGRGGGDDEEGGEGERKDPADMRAVKKGTAGADVAEARALPRESKLGGTGHVSPGPKAERQPRMSSREVQDDNEGGQE